VRLALFDFDGTITKKDSFLAFIRYAVGTPAYLFGMLLLIPVLTAYALRIVPNSRAKAIVIRYFFKGWEIERFHQVAHRFSLEILDRLVRPNARKRINWHKERGDRIIIVSASMECWLEPWCTREGIELIATRLEQVDGKLTGRFETLNCHGEEKVRRIKDLLEPADYDRILAYGDTKGDLPMLSLAHERFFQPFKRGSST
jgi:phosphatidylglycerophosphatase C